MSTWFCKEIKSGKKMLVQMLNHLIGKQDLELISHRTSFQLYRFKQWGWQSLSVSSKNFSRKQLSNRPEQVIAKITTDSQRRTSYWHEMKGTLSWMREKVTLNIKETRTENSWFFPHPWSVKVLSFSFSVRGWNLSF